MNLLKYILPCALAACGFAASVQAAGFSTTQEARETDAKALSEFVKSKSSISVQEKGGNLMVSGDARTEWETMRAKSNHHRRRGSGSAINGNAPFATNEFSIEANLKFDYKGDRTWSAIQLQLDNAAGIPTYSSRVQANPQDTLFGSGSLDNLVLRKAYFGYNVAEAGTSRFDVELGRRRLYDVFDSKVQFYSIFDGLTLKYANSYEGVMDLQAKLAALVVDFNVNHFAYVGELGFMNIADEGIDFKYAYTHWNRDGANRYGFRNAHGADFKISQFQLAYTFSPDFLRHKTQVYGAYLINHAGHPNKFSSNKKAREAFYVGFKVGEVKRQNDWAFEANYQWVQAQAVPEFDVRGIGRDNPAAKSFYVTKTGGFANYKGYYLDAIYALTDNLSIDANFSRTHQQSHKIGGKFRAWQLELAAIYAF